MSIYEELILRLSEAKIPSPRLESRLLIAFVCNCQADEISSQTLLNHQQLELLEELVAQRLQHKPLDKIIGKKDFYKYSFVVTEDVLSPRPDTEVLVESAISLIKEHKLHNVLDLGTGSGCILCSILGDCPQIKGVGIDKSLHALKIAKQNAINIGVDKQINWVNANWFASDFSCKFSDMPKFDIIVSNPPYIPTQDILQLEPEVKNHDPIQALDGGDDGLDSYKQILALSDGLLVNDGWLLFEAGINQSQDIVLLAKTYNFECLHIVRDIAGIERCIIFRKNIAI